MPISFGMLTKPDYGNTVTEHSDVVAARNSLCVFGDEISWFPLPT